MQLILCVRLINIYFFFNVGKSCAASLLKMPPTKRDHEGTPINDDPAPSATTNLIFIRHGESEYNKTVRETGKDPLIRDAPLTETGQAQALQARIDLKAILGESVSPDLILMSPLTRAITTCLIACNPSKLYPTSQVEVWPELRVCLPVCVAMAAGMPSRVCGYGCGYAVPCVWLSAALFARV